MTPAWACRYRVVALAVATLGLLSVCKTRGPVRERGLDVLLITIDTLRADRLGAYGDQEARTPVIDRLAAAGVRFQQAHANAVVTLVSHANILSGLYPFVHGVRDNDGYRFPQDRDTLATLLRGAGYRTAAFVSGFPLDARFGLQRGFDLYDDRLGSPEEAARGFHLEERSGRDTVAAALRWLRTDARPSFCWVHLYEPHAPYRPPEPFAAAFRQDPYRGEVAAADDALKALLEPLLVEGRRGRTLVVLTADHGESLGEHGERTHGLLAYEATLHVPLIVFAPRLFEPRVVPALVRHVDLLPTILDAIDVAAPPGLSGRSLVPLLEGRSLAPSPSYFEALSASFSRGWAPLHGVIVGTRKYVDLPIPELYDLGRDPGETRNLAAGAGHELAVDAELLAALRHEGGKTARVEQSEETRERLRSLGYLSPEPGLAKERYTRADDPKVLIGTENELDRVIELEERGQSDRALSLCRDVAAKMPRATAPLVQLALLQRGRGELAQAIGTLQQAFSLNPMAPQVLFRLGQLLGEAGRWQEAVRTLAPFAKRDGVDLDALMTLGVSLARTGRTREALALLEGLRARDPSNALCLLNVGTVYLMTKDLDRARSAVEAALAVQPDLATAHNTLGVIAAGRGDAEQAIAEWKRAVDLDPRAYDTLFNLGMLLLQQARPAEARTYLERFAREAPAGQYRGDIGRVRAWLAAQEAPHAAKG